MFLLALCIGITILFYFYKRIRFDYWNKINVPTASGCHWLYGHYKEALFQEKHIRTVVQKIYEEFPEAPVVGYFRLHTPGLLIRDPEVMKTILISEFSNFGSNGFIMDKNHDFLAGFNPFFVQGDAWRATRTHVAAALTAARLRAYLPRMRAVADDMDAYLARVCGGAPALVDVKHLASTFTTDVLGSAICGVASASFTSPASLFSRITREVSFATSVPDNFKDALQATWPALSRVFKMRFSSPKSEELLLHVTRKVIEERTSSGAHGDDLYQVAMALREKDTDGVFTDEYISSLVYTVMLDQYETSSNAMVGTLLALALHPDVQDKLRKEILEFKGQNKGKYCVDDVENLKYLDMVLSESMRIFSPVPLLSRVCTNDCSIPIPGFENPLKLKKGTPVIVATQAMHMDPRYYTHPDKFDPERFSQEEVAKRPKYTYLPFGEGPKRCLGPRLGALQIKVALMSVVEHYSLRPAKGGMFPPDIKPGIFLIASPAPPTGVIFEPLNVDKPE